MLTLYPNPFNPSTTIRYRVDEPGMVTLSVYNVSGQLVRRLVESEHQPGSYTVVWDGRNAAGQPVASGVYLVRLTYSAANPQDSHTNANEVSVRRVTLVR